MSGERQQGERTPLGSVIHTCHLEVRAICDSSLR